MSLREGYIGADRATADGAAMICTVLVVTANCCAGRFRILGILEVPVSTGATRMFLQSAEFAPFSIRQVKFR
jgi:hypothetical protein